MLTARQGNRSGVQVGNAVISVLSRSYIWLLRLITFRSSSFIEIVKSISALVLLFTSPCIRFRVR